MLAQNFKMPADLGISDVEFESLVKVLSMLERLEIKKAPTNSFWGLKGWANEYEPTMFFMGHEVGEAKCGTACCLMGWARKVSNNSELFKGAWYSTHPANALFYPYGDGINCRDPEKGAIVLRNYLTRGKPYWQKVMSE